MGAARVTLEIRGPDGRFYPAEYEVDGRPIPSTGAYYLRYTENGSRRRERLAATEPEELLFLRRRKEAHLAGLAHGITAMPASAVKSRSTTVREAAEVYFGLIESKAPATQKAYRRSVLLFCTFCGPKILASIDRDTLRRFHVWLQRHDAGFSDHTCYNHFVRSKTFLNDRGQRFALEHKDWPTYEKDVNGKYPVYTEHEVAMLLLVAGPVERLLIQYFAGTGFRLREVAHSQFGDIDGRAGTITTRAKPEFRFRTKDHEKRSVEVSQSLLDGLGKLRQSRNADGRDLIFPNRAGGVNRHLDRVIDRIIRRARKKGHDVKRPVKPCHAFRVLFACRRSQAGIDIETVRTMLGHSDVSTTQHYLRSSEHGSAGLRRKIETADSFQADPRTIVNE